jgi:pimeloyl-ACP methyl ester carboxylesterase
MQPRMQTADLDGPVCYAEYEGPAERTFVLVHGLGGSHLSWKLVAPRLAQHGRVLALDLPGFGVTPRAGRSSSLFANRRVLSRFVGDVATGDVVLVGNSMGGAIALLQAAVEPGSVGRLVLTSPVLPFARGGRPAPIVIAGFTLYRLPVVGPWFVRKRFTDMTPEQAVRVGFELTAAHPERLPADVVDEHVELLRERRENADNVPAFIEGARSILRLLGYRGLTRRAIGSVRCPVLVIHGERDRFVPAAFSRAAAVTRPSWRLCVFPHAGHIPQLEEPDAWLAAVEEWLSATGAR